ncbi:MAG: spherulation-specific family 4 protein [Thermoplasmatales archaeon]
MTPLSPSATTLQSPFPFGKSPLKIGVIVIAILLVGSFVFVALYPYFTHTSVPSAQILIPLYSCDPSQFQEILNLQSEHRSDLFSIIVNPNNGSGITPNATLSAWISKSMSAGINVLGYVDTDYGNKSLTNIIEEVYNYSKWYHLHGIFLYEVSDSLSEKSFYSNIVNQSKTLGINFTVGNPGDFVPYDYLSVFNITVIYENNGYPSLSSLEEYAHNVPRSELAVIAYGVPFSLSEVVRISVVARTIYFTNQNLPNPYQNLSSYLPELASVFS